MKKRGKRVKELDKFIWQRLNESGEDGATALEKIVDNLIDKAQRTTNVKLIELLLNRAYGAPKLQVEATHTHNNKESVPPIAWADQSQLTFGFDLDENEKKALGHE